jgi:hypothetical protein
MISLNKRKLRWIPNGLNGRSAYAQTPGYLNCTREKTSELGVYWKKGSEC